MNHQQHLCIRSVAALIFCFVMFNPTAAGAAAQEEVKDGTTHIPMPVREVTIFKDGHALLRHEGEMPTGDSGDVVLDYLPVPILGTFWPYSADEGVRLASVKVGPRTVDLTRSATSVSELIEANIGANVELLSNIKGAIRGNIVKIIKPTWTSQTPKNQVQSMQGSKTALVVIATEKGHLVMDLNSFRTVTFLDGHFSTGYSSPQVRNTLLLDLDWGDASPAEKAEVGLIYIQKGLRWIPNYRLTLHEGGTATLELQATILNELVDLENVTAHLVVGVPRFAFHHTLDPMAMRGAAAELSQYFDTDSRSQRGYSAALWAQASRAHERVGNVSDQGDALLDVADLSGKEDHFMFRVEGLTLAKGERLVTPIVKCEIPYEDVYDLTLPMLPTVEMRSKLNSMQQRELEEMMRHPRVMHKIRLRNESKQPITTAPVMIVKDGSVLAQDMTTYTQIGGVSEMTITTAVDVSVNLEEKETKRTPDGINWAGRKYPRIDLEGSLRLRNFQGESVKVRVSRYVYGRVDAASGEADISNISLFSPDRSWRPAWVQWNTWSLLVSRLNPINTIQWNIPIDAGQGLELSYKWHYFWR